MLKGTFNCKEGEHSWLSYNRYLIDTTLMLIIKEDYAKKIGYVETNRYDPSINEMYMATKEFTNEYKFHKK